MTFYLSRNQISCNNSSRLTIYYYQFHHLMAIKHLDTPQTNENGTIIGIHPKPKLGGQGAIHFSILASLVGQNGYLLEEIHRQVNHPALVLIFDAANIITQGYTAAETLQQQSLR